MITEPLYPFKEPGRKLFFHVWLWKEGEREACLLCETVGVRVMERWTERNDEFRPGLSYSRQTMMPCHCVVVSTMGLGGCGKRADIPYPRDEETTDDVG